VGSSGAGKTTLVDVILGLQSLTSGTVAIDGIAYSSAAQIRRGIFGYVPQESFLTDDTIRRNIALGLPDDEIDDDLVSRAIAMAAIEDVIANLPRGLGTVVGDRGMRLSGGQRQRIGIARALYHDPQVLILDEATSSIDMTTEAEISAAVHELRGQKTVIVIAHRLSTVRECDRVVFFKNGRIVDEGQFDNLIQMNDDFADMVRRMGADGPAPALDGVGPEA
jgi:ATP-binding cassette subfamily C protein